MTMPTCLICCSLPAKPLDFAATVDFDAFRGNRMAQLAILKAIEIVGEAAPVSLRSSQQRIPTSRGGHRRHAQPPRPRLRRHRSRTRLGDRAARHPPPDTSARTAGPAGDGLTAHRRGLGCGIRCRTAATVFGRGAAAGFRVVRQLSGSCCGAESPGGNQPPGRVVIGSCIWRASSR